MFGPQTATVDGQRNIFPSSYQYNPQGYGPQTAGVPQVSPTMPPFIGSGSGSALGAGMEGVGGYGTAGNNALVTQIASENPHNLKVSPVWWAVGALVVGLVALKVVHWRSLEEGSEKLDILGAKETASESA